ncbi:hypothetical protein H0H92_003430 [Tricholoma furcatifolium]|nr:hypothetical protein H0H92_011758 [Tricholoma furcatifolium]KAG6825510.1 hypothetical protein H0H92_003430 [Tricholoma furcatifolium]
MGGPSNKKKKTVPKRKLGPSLPNTDVGTDTGPEQASRASSTALLAAPHQSNTTDEDEQFISSPATDTLPTVPPPSLEPLRMTTMILSGSLPTILGFLKAVSEMPEGQIFNAIWSRAFSEGRDQGKEEGWKEGRDQGLDEGYGDGRDEGWQEGWTAGVEAGKEKTEEIMVQIEDLKWRMHSASYEDKEAQTVLLPGVDMEAQTVQIPANVDTPVQIALPTPTSDAADLMVPVTFRDIIQTPALPVPILLVNEHPAPIHSWADDTDAEIQETPVTTTLTPRDFSTLRTGFAPFRAIQRRSHRLHRAKRQWAKPQRIFPPRMDYNQQPIITRRHPSGIATDRPAFIVHQSPPPYTIPHTSSPVHMDWDRDPRLVDLSRALRNLGWIRP